MRMVKHGEEDELIAEIRKYRHEHARKHGYDLEAIVADMKTREKAPGNPLVTLKPKPVRGLKKTA